MSTKFFIKVEEQEVEVAYRGNGGYISINNPLVLLLHDDILLDNDNAPSGIETVGDLKNTYKEQEIKYANY